ncbi:MAG: GHKL domain-containing protein [Paludibacter sp.]|nr:GHKL domain-containing protein [Paludibacter sp.]
MKFDESRTTNLKIIESIVYLVIWMSVFSIPYFQNRQYEIVNWGKVFAEWIRMLSFLVIFLLNVYFLIPKLLFKKKYLQYIGLTLLSILIVIGISISIRIFITHPHPLAMPPMNLGPGMPPMELGSKMPAPMGYRPPTLPVQKSIFMIFIDNFIIAVLVVGAGTTIKLMSKWQNEEGKRKDVEKEQLKTELALLRHQVSPHFFMNTLNNIHALVDINTEIAKDAIIRLSTLMRYLLYETAHGQTSLKKEIEFIESYITLMQLRFSKKVIITVNVPLTIPDIQIPPMLFISLLENAFKHGVSYQYESFVNFNLEIIDNQLNCSIKNSKQRSKENQDKAYSGIGLVNIKKSLALLFNEDFTFKIKENENEFEVQLSIPIYVSKESTKNFLSQI